MPWCISLIQIVQYLGFAPWKLQMHSQSFAFSETVLQGPCDRQSIGNQKMPKPDHITDTQKQFIADYFGNTELALVRIARNLGLGAMSDDDVVRHCDKVIQSTPIQDVEIRGKNYYFHSREHSAVLIINKSSLGIITAKRID
jgi:hypothetical protein